MTDTPINTLDDLLGLRGKKAVVVGGGYGMGLSTARLLALAGCDVAVIDIDEAAGQNAVDAAREAGGQSHLIVGDILAPGAPDRLVAQAEKALGGLDRLVTIVGQAGWSSFLDMDEETWTLDQERNLRAVAFCARAAARSMRDRKAPGAVTVIASVSGLTSGVNHASYGAAKAGLINVVKAMAVECGPLGVRVNAVAPGSIATPRVLTLIPSPSVVNDPAHNKQVPLRRMGQPDEIGKAVLFLSSDLASYVSGHTLVVDGGATVTFPWAT